MSRDSLFRMSTAVEQKNGHLIARPRVVASKEDDTLTPSVDQTASNARYDSFYYYIGDIAILVQAN